MSQYRKALFILVILKFYLTLFLLLYADIGLAPDEAQYWVWSNSLDFGYFSKPPAIAWQIHLGTLLFGDTLLGVRFFSLLLSALIIPLVYRLGRGCDLSRKESFAACLCFAATPLSFFISFAATTDVGYLFFWTFTLAEIVRGAKANPKKLGLLIAFGALFKWAIYWLLLPVLCLRVFFPAFRGVIQTFAISLLGLLPSLYWNVFNDFATFRHVMGNMMGKGGHLPGTDSNFLDFFLGQVLVLSPILFILLGIALYKAVKARGTLNAPLRLLRAFSLFIALVFIGASLFQKMQVNWLYHLYPGALVFLGWDLRQRWQLTGVAFSLALVFFILAVPSLQEKGSRIPYGVNPFRHSLGWEKLESGLKDVGYNPESDFLVGDKYQTTSILSFYSPGKKRAYFLNLGKARKNQFDYFESMEREKGNNGFFVWIEANIKDEEQIKAAKKHYEEKLAFFFDSVDAVQFIPLFSTYQGTKKGAWIFRGENYNGKTVESPELY